MAIAASSIAVAGVRSPVIDSGPADADEAVVIVHGTPGSGHDWDGLIAQLRDFARAVAPDMPGFGAVDKPRGFDRVPVFADHSSVPQICRATRPSRSLRSRSRR
ncbi:hypothetical protein BH20ACT17_BH20ACT17_03400 [soil metagenome]